MKQLKSSVIKKMCLTGSIFITVFLTGCSLNLQKQKEKIPKIPIENLQVGIQTVDDGKMQYTSKDSLLSITLPSSSWKVEKEFDVLYSFTSDDADIKITHMIGADAKKILPAYKEDDMLERIKQEKEKEAQQLQQSQTAEKEKQMDENQGEEGQQEQEQQNEQAPETVPTEEFTLENYKCNIFQNTAYYTYRLVYQNVEQKYCQLVLGVQGTKEIYEVTATLYKEDQLLESSLKVALDSFLLIRNTQFEDGLSRSKTYEESTTDGSVSVKGFKKVKIDYTKEEDGKPKSGDLYTCVSPVNVRDSGGMNSSVIGSLDAGEEVKVLSQEGGWYEIEFEGESGFVYKDYLEQ